MTFEWGHEEDEKENRERCVFCACREGGWVPGREHRTKALSLA